jgi:hypothetical protein
VIRFQATQVFMSESAEDRLERRLSDHRAAVREFIEKASALHPTQWLIPRAELLSELQRRADVFHSIFVRMWRTEPRRLITHPMFGALTLDHAIRLLSVHTRHHAALLPARSQPLQEKT